MRYWNRRTTHDPPRVRQVVREASPLVQAFADQTPFREPRDAPSDAERALLERMEEITSIPEVSPSDETEGGVGTVLGARSVAEIARDVANEAMGTLVRDHGHLIGRGDDDHTQYHNDTRGDARYLYRSNDTPYSPTGDYNPATKKYVDDASGTGEVNDGANVGTDGVGVFDGKVGTDLQFRHVASSNSLLSIALDAVDNDIDFTVEEANIDHDSLANTHNLTTDVDHDAIANTHNLTTDVDHDTISNTHNLTTDVDHGSIGGLGDDDHAQYHNDARGDARYYT